MNPFPAVNLELMSGENRSSCHKKGKKCTGCKDTGTGKSRKTIRADPGLEEKVEMYKELFLDRKKSVHRKADLYQL